MRQGKQLYRDTDNARIAGVCAGIAHYFGLETWLVRILTVTGFFLLAGRYFHEYVECSGCVIVLAEKKIKNKK